MSTLVSALIITGIGMGLVFVAILLLWGGMEVMVRFGARFARDEEEGEGEVEAEEEAPAEDAADASALRRKAAAAAVAAALALRPSARLSQSPTGEVSAWQSVQRANRLTQRVSAYSRKQRGTLR